MKFCVHVQLYVMLPARATCTLLTLVNTPFRIYNAIKIVFQTTKKNGRSALYGYASTPFYVICYVCHTRAW
jgi:hypothetical protein